MWKHWSHSAIITHKTFCMLCRSDTCKTNSLWLAGPKWDAISGISLGPTTSSHMYKELAVCMRLLNLCRCGLSMLLQKYHVRTWKYFPPTFQVSCNIFSFSRQGKSAQWCASSNNSRYTVKCLSLCRKVVRNILAFYEISSGAVGLGINQSSGLEPQQKNLINVHIGKTWTCHQLC